LWLTVASSHQCFSRQAEEPAKAAEKAAAEKAELERANAERAAKQQAEEQAASEAAAEAEKSAAEAEKAEEAALAQTAAESASDQSPALEKELADATGEAHPGKVCTLSPLWTANRSCQLAIQAPLRSCRRVQGRIADVIPVIPWGTAVS
jgi:hypothetical protein